MWHSSFYTIAPWVGTKTQLFMLYMLDACVWSGTKHFIIFRAHSHTCIRVMCLAIVHSWMHRRKLWFSVQPKDASSCRPEESEREPLASGSGSSRVVQGVIKKFKNQRTLPYLNIVRQTEVSSPKVAPPPRVFVQAMLDLCWWAFVQEVEQIWWIDCSTVNFCWTIQISCTLISTPVYSEFKNSIQFYLYSNSLLKALCIVDQRPPTFFVPRTV